MLSVIMMNVVLPSVVEPLIIHYSKLECLAFQKLVILVIFVSKAGAHP
jgi:hypothetical protein